MNNLSKFIDLLSANITILAERRYQNTTIMYHGTSDVFLDSILKNGLMANPPRRTYGGDEDDPGPAGYETFGGIYLTPKREDAVFAARRSAKKFGGNPIIVVVQYVMGSGNVDEDIFTHMIAKSIQKQIDDFYRKVNYSSDDVQGYDNFTEYEQYNRDEVVDAVVSEIMDSAASYYKVGRTFRKNAEDAVEWVLNHVDEDVVASNNMMSVARSSDEFVSIIQNLMDNAFPLDRESNIQVTRDIKFKGKTKIIRIENIHEELVWRNPNA